MRVPDHEGNVGVFFFTDLSTGIQASLHLLSFPSREQIMQLSVQLKEVHEVPDLKERIGRMGNEADLLREDLQREINLRFRARNASIVGKRENALGWSVDGQRLLPSIVYSISAAPCAHCHRA